MVNGDAPTAMAQAAAAKGVPFLHISTDYVFDGAGTRPFAPTTRPPRWEPMAARNSRGNRCPRGRGKHLILRTSWVVSAHGANFVKTMLRLGPSAKA